MRQRAKMMGGRFHIRSAKLDASSIVPFRFDHEPIRTRLIIAPSNPLPVEPIDEMVVDDHPFLREGIIAWLLR